MANLQTDDLQSNDASPSNIQTATLGGGCFWCLDAVFRKIKGVNSVVSGFSGGLEVNPSYELACSGQTGHIEVVEVQFDDSQIGYEALLAIFFAAHDPTQIDGQGYDIGPQYMSVVFHHDQEQQQICQQLIDNMNSSAIYDKPIITSVRPAMPFYAAPAGHQNFYQLRQGVPYCQIIIEPKLEKIRALFADKLKTT